MEIVDIKESERLQKNTVKELIDIVKARKLNSKTDIDMLFEYITKIASLECGDYLINLETEKIDNGFENEPDEDIKYVDQTIGFACKSENPEKDRNIAIDVFYFCKKFLESESIDVRYDGIVEMLGCVYHEVEHIKQQMEVERARIKPEALILAQEMLVKSLEGEKFYGDNYDVLSSEAYAEVSSRLITEDILGDDELIKKIKISDEIKNAENLANSRIGKIYYGLDKKLSKDAFFKKMCDIYVKKDPSSLYDYPILQKVYDANGKPKKMQALIEDMIRAKERITNKYFFAVKDPKVTLLMQKELMECEMFYFEAIEPLIESATFEEYNKIAKVFGVANLQGFFSKMIKYVNYKAKDKMEASEFKSKYQNGVSISVDTEEEIKGELEHRVNSIVRFLNGVTLNKISEKLLREGGHIRGTREKLPDDVRRRRVMFAKSMVGIYDSIETKEEYEQRANMEKSDIDLIINSLYFNRFENFMVQTDNANDSKVGLEHMMRIAQILKISQILAKESGKNYFEEFLMIPDVNMLIATMDRNKNDSLRKRIEEGIKHEIYPATEAEEGKYREYVSGEGKTEDNFERIKMLNKELPNVKLKARGIKSRRSWKERTRQWQR